MIMRFMIKQKRNESGAVIVTVALLLFLLLGFMGLALDLGHLFVVRTELQTSMDACALAAAQELNGQPDALARATNAGIAAGNANRVDLQSANWSGKGQVTAGDISFRDQNHNVGATSATARYVRCNHIQHDTKTSLVHMAGLLVGSSAFAAKMDVAALAEATTTPAQSTCPMPLALKPKAGGTKPNYGFAKGEWVTLLSKTNATAGQIGWANLDGSTSASETEAELKGYCGTKVGSKLGTPGVQGTIADTWNARFGIYKNNSGPDVANPDFTGFVYTKAGTWPSGSNAYSNFVTRRQTFDNCAATVSDCENLTKLKLNQFTKVATGGANGDLKKYGTNRRLVVVPVVDGGNSVIDFACMLLLQPIPSPFDDVQLEFLGNASDAASPCTANGLPGGAAGPLVPVLVR
jgi:Flp pilus assembly protein TadG